MPGMIIDSKELKGWISLCGLLSDYFLGISTRKGKKNPEEQNYMVDKCTVGNYSCEYMNLKIAKEA